MQPEIIILDEPSSNLDIATIEELKQAIKRWKDMGKNYFDCGASDLLSGGIS